MAYRNGVKVVDTARTRKLARTTRLVKKNLGTGDWELADPMQLRTEIITEQEAIYLRTRGAFVLKFESGWVRVFPPENRRHQLAALRKEERKLAKEKAKRDAAVGTT